MRRIFSVGRGSRVPDGTKVYPLLNCQDSTSGLPWNLLEDFSLAVGEIRPNRRSKIHLMPLVTQVTFVLQGRMEAYMKGRDDPAPYSLRLKKEQAILTRPGTFLQFRNDGRAPCRVLYFVSPAYLYVKKDGKVLYDDAIVLDEDWTELERMNWKPEKIRRARVILQARRRAARRIAEREAGLTFASGDDE